MLSKAAFIKAILVKNKINGVVLKKVLRKKNIKKPFNFMKTLVSS